MDATAAEAPKQHTAPTRRGTRGGRRGGRRPFFEKKRTQRRIELDDLSKKYKSFQIEPELYQVLAPLDPTFAFDIAVLDFDLRVSRHYPQQGDRPSMLVNNKDIARGHAARIEQAFLAFEGTLVERVDKVVAGLEALLSLPPLRTVTIVKRKPQLDQASQPIKSSPQPPQRSQQSQAAQPAQNAQAAQPAVSLGPEPKNEPSQKVILEDSSDPASLLDSLDIDDRPESESESDSALGPAYPTELQSEPESESESEAEPDHKHESDDEDIDMGGATTAKPKREGTELVFPDISLTNIAVCEISSLNLLFQCGRCKTAHTFRNVRSAEYGRASKPLAEQCGKCDLPLMVAFRKDFLHSMSHIAGYLDVDGGRPIDLLPSTYSALCAQCQSPAPFKNVDLGALRLQSCRHCHTKMSMKVELFNFSLLSTETIDAAAKRAERSKLPPSAPKQHLNLTGGEPLPNEGRCTHYRRSARWFRFSCCQRVFACDKCHDSEMQHPAEQANRMLCGFCSREQRFSQKCKFCEHDFTTRHARFWEGGKGARDQQQMSRKDKHKYKRSAAERSQKQATHFQGKSKAAA